MSAPEMGSPWPASARRREDGSVELAGLGLAEVARHHGTPVYVLDEGEFRTNARRFRDAFERAFARLGADVEIYYAGKAFLSVAVAQWAYQEGLRVDTATGGELETAVRAGVPGGWIGLHGNNKSDEEILRALEVGIGRIIVDSHAEIDRLVHLAQQLPKAIPVMVRVTTGVHAGGHEYISTAHEDQKFGLSIAPTADGGDSPAMAALLRVAHDPGLHLLGIHSHIGSQILDPTGFEVAAAAVLGLRRDLAERTGTLVADIDLGGGYGIAYLPGETPLAPTRVAEAIVNAVERAGGGAEEALPTFSFEPGRSIVGSAGITLYTVGTVKSVTVNAPDGTTFTRTYVSVDGGMSDAIRTALYDAEYHAEIVSRASAAAPVACRVVGKHCESGDIVVRDVLLPGDIRAGDVLAVAATGAYGRSMASNYNMVPRPPVVAITQGHSRVLVRRETLDDLLGLDQG